MKMTATFFKTPINKNKSGTRMQVFMWVLIFAGLVSQPRTRLGIRLEKSILTFLPQPLNPKLDGTCGRSDEKCDRNGNEMKKMEIGGGAAKNSNAENPRKCCSGSDFSPRIAKQNRKTRAKLPRQTENRVKRRKSENEEQKVASWKLVEGWFTLSLYVHLSFSVFYPCLLLKEVTNVVGFPT